MKLMADVQALLEKSTEATWRRCVSRAMVWVRPEPAVPWAGRLARRPRFRNFLFPWGLGRFTHSTYQSATKRPLLPVQFSRLWGNSGRGCGRSHLRYAVSCFSPTRSLCSCAVLSAQRTLRQELDPLDLLCRSVRVRVHVCHLEGEYKPFP